MSYENFLKLKLYLDDRAKSDELWNAGSYALYELSNVDAPLYLINSLQTITL